MRHDESPHTSFLWDSLCGVENEKLWDEWNEHLSAGWDREHDPIFADSILDNLNPLQSSKQKCLTQIFPRKMLSTVAELSIRVQWVTATEIDILYNVMFGL